MTAFTNIRFEKIHAFLETRPEQQAGNDSLEPGSRADLEVLNRLFRETIEQAKRLNRILPVKIDVIRADRCGVFATAVLAGVAFRQHETVHSGFGNAFNVGVFRAF